MASEQQEDQSVWLDFTKEITFSTPTKTGKSTVVLHARADLLQDHSSVYLRLTTIGMHSKPLLRLPGEFVGPFPTLVSFEAKPISGTSGPPSSSKWPTCGTNKSAIATANKTPKFPWNMFHAKTSKTSASYDSDVCVIESSHWQKHIPHGTYYDPSQSRPAHVVYGPDPDNKSAVFFGEMKSWDGPAYLRIPDSGFRYEDWQSLPYMATNSSGFNNDSLDHTFKWDKTDDDKEIIFAIKWRGRVGYLLSDGESTDKPYKYICEDLESSEECRKVRLKSTGSTLYFDPVTVL